MKETINLKCEIRTMKQVEKQLREINDKLEHIIFRLMDDDPRVCCGRRYCKNSLEESGNGNFKDI